MIYLSEGPIIKIIIKIFKKQKYKIDLVLPAKGFSDLARKKNLIQ